MSPKDFRKVADQVTKTLNTNDGAELGDVEHSIISDPPQPSMADQAKEFVEQLRSRPSDIMNPAGIGTTSVPQSQYDKVTPDIDVIDRSEGFSSQGASEGGGQFIPNVQTPKYSSARPAVKYDLATLDESNILDLPMIEAKSFDVPAILQVKPKDASLRFRWVNFKNEEGGNYQKFKAIGYANATTEDVSEATPIGENLLIDGTTIKFYDVILMKIGVIRLMQAYKANIFKSLAMVGRSPERALKEARRVWNNEVSPDMVKAMKDQGLTVDFYIPPTGSNTEDTAEFDKKFGKQNIDFRT